MYKGQVELIAILGVVVVGIVAVFYAFQSGAIGPINVPSSVQAEQEQVRNSVVNLIREGTSQAIDNIEVHGGYLSPEFYAYDEYYDDVSGFDSVPHAIFMHEGVPYWKQCQANIAPSLAQVERALEFGISTYVARNVEGLAGTERNVSIDISQIRVDARILENKVDVDVYLPTTVQGYPLNSYRAYNIETQLGRIYNFASNYASAASGGRYFEWFTVYAIQFSRTLPTVGALTECGEAIVLSPGQVAGGLQGAAEYVVGNTIWWEKMPDVQPKVFAIDEVNGKVFRDLEPDLYLPDFFDVNSANSVIVTNNQNVFQGEPYMMPVCLAFYDQKYSVAYPLILRVKDELTGNYFNFADLVYVDSLQPGSCGAVTMTTDDMDDFIESFQEPDLAGLNLPCSAKIYVRDSQGNPLRYAVAHFRNNIFAVTDENGKAEGPIECGEGELVVYYPGYETLMKDTAASGINGTYNLYGLADNTFHFRTVQRENKQESIYLPSGATGTESYTVCSIQDADKFASLQFSSSQASRDSYIVTNMGSDIEDVDESALAECGGLPAEDAMECINSLTGGVDAEVAVDYLPKAQYTVIAQLTEGTDLLGGFQVSHTLTDGDVYVNIPIGNATTVAQKQGLANDLYSQCGIRAMGSADSASAVRVSSCDCNTLKAVMEGEGCSGGDFTRDTVNDVWECTTSEVVSAASACGIEMAGC